MSDAITLLRPGPEDFDQLMAIRDGLFDNPLDPDQTRAFLLDPLHMMVLAYDGKDAVGMASGQIMLHPDKAPAFFINEVGVRDSHQRRGIATRVSQAIMSDAKDRGCIGIWLATETDNGPARALYRSLGADEQPVIYVTWDHPV